MRMKISNWILTGSLLLLSACASTPPTSFYVLEPLGKPSASAISAEKKHLIGVGPISIPALIERQKIVTRTAANGVEIAEFHQWASPLKENITQVLTHNLSLLMPDDVVRSYPWGAFGSVDYRIIVDVVRFDTQPGKLANLETSWAIMNEKNHQILTHGRSRIEQPLSDASYAGTVHALSALLGEFSRELSLALVKIK
jgi:uncharacterized lipoprotein YmbA